jgi:hypothetical protein
VGPTINPGILNFEISLRGFSNDQSQILREKKWSNVPYKDKKEFPKSYPSFKEELEQRKMIRSG